MKQRNSPERAAMLGRRTAEQRDRIPKFTPANMVAKPRNRPWRTNISRQHNPGFTRGPRGST